MEAEHRYRYCYAIQVPLPDGENWFDLVIALTAEHAGEVVRVILACGGPDPPLVRVQKRPLD